LPHDEIEASCARPGERVGIKAWTVEPTIEALTHQRTHSRILGPVQRTSDGYLTPLPSTIVVRPGP